MIVQGVGVTFNLCAPRAASDARSGADSRLAGMRQRQKGQQRAQLATQARKVQLVRAYRRGELPDIEQITVADFIKPLREPLKHDTFNHAQPFNGRTCGC